MGPRSPAEAFLTNPLLCFLTPVTPWSPDPNSASQSASDLETSSQAQTRNALADNPKLSRAPEACFTQICRWGPAWILPSCVSFCHILQVLCRQDKLFGKRLLQAGRYIMSHKSWMKTVPTENCDVLMTFPDTTDDHTLLWLLNHIRVGIPELIVQVRHHRHTRTYGFFLTATYESLLRGADELGLRKAVKAEFGGGTRGFSCEEDFIYENVESELRFFTSQERQSIIRFWLENLRAKAGEALHNVRFLEDQPIIPELAARGIIQQVFPVHEQRILNRLMKSWVQAVCENQPLDEICDYFGVKIAMYFAWLGFYTSAMVYPAVFGSVLYTFTEADQTSRDICCVIFAIFNVIWSTLFLEEWKRRGAEFAYKWGTLDTPGEAIEEPRPQFRGVRRISPVTNAEEFYYPPWKRLLFQLLVSLPVCATCLIGGFLLMLGCFQLQELVLSVKGLPRLVRFLPKIGLALLVSACAEAYKKLAYWLNDMENYRLQSAYEKHLIVKIVLFQFVNSYLSLFYIGFYLKDMERLKEMLATLLITRQFLQNIREVLQPHLYRRLTSGDLSAHTLWEFSKTFLQLLTHRPPVPEARPREPLAGPPEPRAQEGSGGRKCLNGGCGVPEEEEEERRRRAGEGGEEGGGGGGGEEEEDDDDEEDEEEEDEEESLLDCSLKLRKLTQAELESCMKKYEDPFQDYQEMFVQFGYVVLFSSAFPLAALCALINNLIEIRSDAFKLCTGLQRPFGQRVDSIGQWQKVMEAMGILAIVVNCYLIGQCGQLQRLFPWLSPEAAIISVVVLEHFALFLKYLIQAAIPDIPAWVAEEMAKLEHQRREAFKKHERQAQHHYQQQQRRRREEEERQRHAEHHARREREAGREEGRAEGSGAELAPEKAPAKAKGGPGPDRPKRPGSLLAPNNVMKLKHMIPLQGKFLSSSSSSSSSPAGGAGPATRQPQAPSPTGENRLPAFLSFKFLKSPEAKRDQERSHSPPKPFHAGKLFPFGGRAEPATANGAGGGQARPDSAPGKAQRPGLADEAGGEEPEARAEEEGSGTAQPASGVPSRVHRRSPAPPRCSCPPSPNTPPPTSCWQWEGPWSCGGEGSAARGEGHGAECPPCARAPGSPAWVPAPLPAAPAQGGDRFSSPPLPGPCPLPPADSPSPSPSPQAICWPAGWH
ncbi:anoctamin-8 isoform 4-T4 [Sarcophilus harrisii]